MKRSFVTAGLLSAAMLATAAPVLAAPPQPECGPMQPEQAGPGGLFGPRHGGPGKFHGADDRGRRPDDRRGPAQPDGLELAAKLSAAETYVGITAAQEGAWRAYTSALIAFFDRPEPPHGQDGPPRPPRDGKNLPPQGEPGAKDAPPAPLFSDRLADRAIEQGEKAQTLKTAVEALRTSLTDEQVVRLAKAEQALAPKPGPKGPRGGQDDGPRRGPGNGPGDGPGEQPGLDRPDAPGDLPPPPAE